MTEEEARAITARGDTEEIVGWLRRVCVRADECPRCNMVVRDLYLVGAPGINRWMCAACRAEVTG
jgi:hypothetical protein